MQRPNVFKCFAWFLALSLAYLVLTGVGLFVTKKPSASEARENREWIASGRFWMDRQSCRWLGLCGLYHYWKQSDWTWQRAADGIPRQIPDSEQFWTSGDNGNPDEWSTDERALRTIPQYVFDHAPYVHLFSGERFWPCDIAEHLVHTTPYLNYTMIQKMENDRNLTNLRELNDQRNGRSGSYIYLQSDDNVEERPTWLGGHKNIPIRPQGRSIPEDDVPRPDIDNWEAFDLPMTKQQAVAQEEDMEETSNWYPDILTNHTSSPNGRCGGNSGYTCEGSKYGRCCSIYGWCGADKEYCNAACDALAGKCDDPLKPNRPHRELRRRKQELDGEKNRPSKSGRSNAPAILIVTPKEDGVVDAFWFFFYSFNQGNQVFNIRFGNHIGDWEHTAIRFRHGKPETVFLSEHDFGDAYSWQALEKYIPSPAGDGTMLGTWANSTAARIAKRPVVYSGVGTHAMYGTPGLHPYILPLGMLHDQTDRGPLWDPTLNLQAFTYDTTTRHLRASTLNPMSPTGWFHYAGRWGDKLYPLSDPRQYRFAGEYHYVRGPMGPKFKNLGRKEACQGKGKCNIHDWLGGRKGVGRSTDVEAEETEEFESIAEIEGAYFPVGT